MISLEEVRKIARLARLRLSDEEASTYASQLSAILEYNDQLRKIDVQGVEPTSHVHGSTNVLREDEIGEHLPVEETLRNAPDRSGRFFRVPLIVGGEE